MITVELTRFPFRDLLKQAKVISGDGTGPVSYSTGGEALALEEIGLSEVWWWAPVVATNGIVTLQAIYDRVSNKLKWFDVAGTEVADLSDLSSYTYTFFITGK